MNHHEVKMISLRHVKKFCKDYTQIENYEEAVNDKSQTWDCHHILGEILTRQQLLDHNFYYDVPPCMLKFVTKAEHSQLHGKVKAGKKNSFFGKHHTEESRARISASHKGILHTKETRIKISESHKGKTLSEETRRKLSEAGKRRWARKNKI